MVNDAFRRLQTEAKDVLTEKAMIGKEAPRLSRFQGFLHFWILAGKSFVRNRCPVRASALAYASLLAMVPMLAVVISVSSSLLKRQGEEPIERFIDKMVASVTPEAAAPTFGPMPAPTGQDSPAATEAAKYVQTRKEVAHRIKEFVGNVRSGTIGVTGMVALVVVAITMLTRIENTFNDIWGVTRGRTWVARVAQYWATITLGPVLLALVVGLTSGPHFQTTKDFLAALPLGVGRLITFGFRFLPFLILSLGFALFYQLMPNTKVLWRAALVGGIVGGSLWQLNNTLNVLYVSRVVKNSAIYGSLGMVPVFMVGLYFAWLILLFGAQVAYAYQNRHTYLQERQAEGVHQRSREFVALRLMTLIAWRFQRAEKPATLTGLAAAVGVPTRLAGQVLQALVDQKLLAEVAEAETAYVPLRPLAQITAHDILQTLRAGKGLDLSTREDSMRPLVHQSFENIALAERTAAANVNLQTMVDRLVQESSGTASSQPA